MVLDATVGEPFLLSSYGIPQRLPKLATASDSYQNLYATHEKASSSTSEGYVTVAAQGDGVHVLNLSTLHPVISHTLGPSTSFSCPAVTLNIVDEQDQFFATYAAVSSSSELSPEECGRTIWMWKENHSSSLADRALSKKKSVLVPHAISRLHVCDDLPERLIVLSPKGDVTVMDTKLNTKSTRPPPTSDRNVLQTFVFSRKSLRYLSARSEGAVIVMIDDSSHVQVVGYSEEEGFIELGETQIPLEANEIIGVSCSMTGHLSVFTRSGSWHSYQLPSSSSSSLTPLGSPINSASLSSTPGETSLLALNTSHVLLASISPSSPSRTIVLLLWDLQYSIVLASHSLPVPATLTQAKRLNITLVHASTAQAILILTPAASKEKNKDLNLRSSVLVVPYTVPHSSTIANAMGRGMKSWLVDTGSASSQLVDTPESTQRKQLLAAMHTAMDAGKPGDADLVFFEWVKEREERGKQNAKEDGEEEVWGYALVKELLNVVLRLSKPQNANTAPAYSPEVLRYLLAQEVVSAGMITGESGLGFLGLLRARGDWTSIQLALRNKTVIDLSESEIIECLRVVIERHRVSDSPDAMHVDSAPNEIPALASFLPLCVSYASSTPLLTQALRRHLSGEPEDVLCVLGMLENWMKRLEGREARLLPSRKRVERNEHGVVVLKEEVKEQEVGEALELSKITSFLHSLLDASFLSLLQHPPAHAVLQRLCARVERQIATVELVEALRGSLEPFARVQAKAIKDGKDGGKKDGEKGDWRQRRRMAHEQAGMAVGVYRLEEIVL